MISRVPCQLPFRLVTERVLLFLLHTGFLLRRKHRSYRSPPVPPPTSTLRDKHLPKPFRRARYFHCAASISNMRYLVLSGIFA